MTKEINIANLHKAENDTLLKCHALKMARKNYDNVYKQTPAQLTEDIMEYVRLSCELDDVSFSDIAS